MKKIKEENKNGALFVKTICKNVNKPDLIEIECKYCGKHYNMWKNHYYRGSNPCNCLNEVLNKRLHRIWINMKTRCYNEKSLNYKQYGKLGIKVCDEWKNSYKSFETWALNNEYKDFLTLDRINIYKNYCPNNCRWVDSNEQNNNKKNNIMFVYKNKKASLKRICEHFNINYKTIHTYYQRNNLNYEELRKYLCNKLKEKIEDFNYNKDYELPLLDKGV